MSADSERENAADAAKLRRQRIAQTLGDVLPATSPNESPDTWGDREPRRDEDYLREVPPHHG